jgi:hypothetical protein
VETELPQIQFRRRRRAGDTDEIRYQKLIASGERRLEYLDKRIDDRLGSRGSLEFDKAERLFVVAALQALRFHQSLLYDDRNPLKALRDLLYHLELLELVSDHPDHDELRRVVARARVILQEQPGD